MTLVQLRHLISLAETGSFSRSAQALFLTQPALSRSIKALEGELGQQLFDRVGWRSDLTPAGHEVLVRARKLVADAEHLKESTDRLRTGASGRLRLGLGSGPAAILTVPLLQHMALQHPGAHLELARGGTGLLVQALRERRLDALVIDARSLMPADDLLVEPLAELRGAFLCRPGHPLLSEARAGLRFKALQAHPIASTPLSDEIARILVERYGPEAHPDSCVTLRCEEIAPLVDVVRSSDAVLLAVRAAAPDLPELPLKPALNATARFGLVTLGGRSAPPLMRFVRPLIDERLRD
jgi:DNA-binding transcriptional LysR family regulator